VASGCTSEPRLGSHGLPIGALPNNCRDPRAAKLLPLYEEREWFAQLPGAGSTNAGFLIFDYTGTPLDPSVRRWNDLLANTGAKLSELLWPQPETAYLVTLLRPQFVNGLPSLAADPQYDGKYFATRRGLAWDLSDIPDAVPRRPSANLRAAQLRREVAFIQTHMWCDAQDPLRDADGNPIPNTCTEKPFEVRRIFLYGDNEPVTLGQMQSCSNPSAIQGVFTIDLYGPKNSVYQSPTADADGFYDADGVVVFRGSMSDDSMRRYFQAQQSVPWITGVPSDAPAPANLSDLKTVRDCTIAGHCPMAVSADGAFDFDKTYVAKSFDGTNLLDQAGQTISVTQRKQGRCRISSSAETWNPMLLSGDPMVAQALAARPIDTGGVTCSLTWSELAATRRANTPRPPPMREMCGMVYARVPCPTALLMTPDAGVPTEPQCPPQGSGMAYVPAFCEDEPAMFDVPGIAVSYCGDTAYVPGGTNSAQVNVPGGGCGDR